MKEYKLYLSDKKTSEDFLRILKEENTTDDIIVTDIQDNKYKTEIVVKINENKLINFYNVLAVYLVIRYTKLNIKKYNEKLQEKIELPIYTTDYFNTIMFTELLKYFANNNVFKEHIFFNFNINGFKEEIEEIAKDTKLKEEINNQLDSIHQELINSGIKINDYEVLTVDYDTDEIKLVNKKGEILTANNIRGKLKVSLCLDNSDKWLSDLAFCSTICRMLRVKQLIIPNEYVELYEDLMKYTQIEDYTPELILK